MMTVSIEGGLYHKEEWEKYKEEAQKQTHLMLKWKNHLMALMTVPTPQSMTGGCSNLWSSNECLRGAISINVICKCFNLGIAS